MDEGLESVQYQHTDTISSSMPIGTIVECLVNHGCPNISSRLDPTQCNEFPISRGGFGDVYQGALLDGTKVALKCFRFYVNGHEASQSTFKHAARELYTWSKCQHPNVVQLMGLVEFRGQIAMVSPWMASGGIDQLNHSDRKIDRCRLCFQIATGLAYLHGIGVVHGDLKGANVLLSDNDDAQLADFGNAALASNTLAFTESSTRFGFSLRWTAPELLQGQTSYSRQADIYSLGMTILEVISRRPPYTDIKNEPGVITAILRRQYPKRPEDTIPKYSEQGDNLWSLLEACWTWDPNRRPEAPSIVKIVGRVQSIDAIPISSALQIETIKPEDLLFKLPEISAGSPLPMLTLNPNVPKTKRSPKIADRAREPRRKRVPRLAMNRLVQSPIAYQHQTSKAKDMLDDVYWEGRDMDDFPTKPISPRSWYVANNPTDGRLPRTRKPDTDAPETAQPELDSKRIYSFHQKVRRLLLELKSHRNPDDEASLSRLEFAIGRGSGLELGELPELEQIVASLELSWGLPTVKVDGPTLDRVEDLILRGQRGGIPSEHRIMAELARQATLGREWKASATSILAQPQREMKDLDQLLASALSIPTLPDMLGKLTRVWLRGRECEKKVEACLRPSNGMPVLIDDATKVATAALNVVLFPAAEELRVLSDEARTWEKTCEDIMSGWFKTRGNATVLDEVRLMRDERKIKFWSFHMPWCDETIRQLAAHDDWISRLPWTDPGLFVLDLDSIVRDMTGDEAADSVPPANEACTCICVEPVVVESGQDTDRVAQCERCLVMFHAKCIMGSCPFCDDRTWDRLIGERTLKLQHLDSQYETACELTQHYSPEYRALKAIRYDNGDSALTELIIKLIKQLGWQESPGPTPASQIRHFMRRLYRIQLEISVRPEIFAYGLSLAHLHRQMTIQPATNPTMRQKPKFVFKVEMDPEASDGSHCLCSGANSDPERWGEGLRCSKCQFLYHDACVAFPRADQVSEPFVCPLCVLKEGESYGPAEVRVVYHDDGLEENAKFVDVKACLDNYSWRVIRCALPPSIRKTITVELFLFIPGTNPSAKQ